MMKMCNFTALISFWNNCFYLMFIICMAAEQSLSYRMLPVHSPVLPCPKIVTRAEWGARESKSMTYLTNQPVPYAFIHHSAGKECFDLDSCKSVVRGYQDFHMDTRGWEDIGYSFIVGGDGTVFEGRGWDRVGAHTLGFNSVGLGFCLSGTFTHFLPPKVQMDAVKQLIDYGVVLGKIAQNYTLRGHRDMKPSTTCPGDALYAEIRTWPHYFQNDDSNDTSRDAPIAVIHDATPLGATINADDFTAGDDVRPTSVDQTVVSNVDFPFIKDDSQRFQHESTPAIEDIGFRSTLHDASSFSDEIEAAHSTNAIRSSFEVTDLADDRASVHSLSPSSHEINNVTTTSAHYSPFPTSSYSGDITGTFDDLTPSSENDGRNDANPREWRVVQTGRGHV